MFREFGGMFPNFRGMFSKIRGMFLNFRGMFPKSGGMFRKFRGKFSKFRGLFQNFGGMFLNSGNKYWNFLMISRKNQRISCKDCRLRLKFRLVTLRTELVMIRRCLDKMIFLRFILRHVECRGCSSFKGFSYGAFWVLLEKIDTRDYFKQNFILLRRFFGPVVQWIEYQIPVLQVVGSSPAGVTFFKRNPFKY